MKSYFTIGFYNKTLPMGVLGSYLLDKLDWNKSGLQLKYLHPIQAIGREVIVNLLEAIRLSSFVEITGSITEKIVH